MTEEFWDTVDGRVFRELLTVNSYELAHGARARKEVTNRRRAVTGHTRPLSPRWLQSLGMWGGLMTLRQIATAVGTGIVATKGYSRGRHLLTRTPTKTATQAELAVRAYASRPTPAREACRELGILPAECVRYRLAAQHLFDLNSITFEELLGWTTDELEHAWAHAGLVVGPPPPRESLTDDDITAIVARVEAELGVAVAAPAT